MFSVISLFAGCGGSSLGYKRAHCQVLGAVEYDPQTALIYQENFKDTHLWETNIAQLEPKAVLDKLGLTPGELTILDGSPPCQGFSMVGKREVCDPRNRLFSNYVQFLRTIRPKAFVMENVPGLVAGKMRGIFYEMVQALAEAGYCVRARILNASHYGVPQNRQRLIVIGLRNDLNLIPLHPKPTSFPITFRQAIQDLPELGLMAYPTGKALQLAKAIGAGETGSAVHQRYQQKENDFSLIRLAWDKPSPTVCRTIRVGQCGLLHPDENRFLSIGELKRVCSFPDTFILLGSFQAQWGRLGNAVPPLLTQAIATTLLSQINEGD